MADWWDDPASFPYHPALVQGAAASNGVVTPQELANQIGQESGFDPNAKSKTSSASGIAQILSGTAKDPGYGLSAVDPSDPEAAIVFAGAYDGKVGVSGYSGGNYSSADIADNSKPVGLNLPSGSTTATAGGDNLSALEQGKESLSSFINNNAAAGITGSTPTKTGQTGIAAVITNYATRAVIIVLALIMVAGGIYLLGDNKIMQIANAVGGKKK